VHTTHHPKNFATDWHLQRNTDFFSFWIVYIQQPLKQLRDQTVSCLRLHTRERGRLTKVVAPPQVIDRAEVAVLLVVVESLSSNSVSSRQSVFTATSSSSTVSLLKPTGLSQPLKDIIGQISTKMF